MIELTPLDVRKKRGDFRRAMRGFEPQEVDAFLELVAERMESLVKENMTLKERSARLADQVREQSVREKAVQDALVTAQELRKDISGQAQREAELMKREAEAEIERMLLDAENRAESLQQAMAELERRRRRFIKGYRQTLERELDAVEAEAARHPLDEKPLELELPGGAAALLESVQAQTVDGNGSGPATPEGGSPTVIDVSPSSGTADGGTHGSAPLTPQPAQHTPAPEVTPSSEQTPQAHHTTTPSQAASIAHAPLAQAPGVDTQAPASEASLAVPVDTLAPAAPGPEPLEEIPEDWGASVRPRLRTEANADSDGF